MVQIQIFETGETVIRIDNMEKMTMFVYNFDIVHFIFYVIYWVLLLDLCIL